MNQLVNWIDRHAHTIIILLLLASIALLGMHIKQMNQPENFANNANLGLIDGGMYPNGIPQANYLGTSAQWQQTMALNPEYTFLGNTQNNPSLAPSTNLEPTVHKYNYYT